MSLGNIKRFPIKSSVSYVPQIAIVFSDVIPLILFQSTCGVHVSKATNTATYNVVLNHQGEVVVAIGDMEAHDEVTAQLVSAFEDTLSRSPVVIIDGNIKEDVIQYCLELCKKHSVPGTYLVSVNNCSTWPEDIVFWFDLFQETWLGNSVSWFVTYREYV